MQLYHITAGKREQAALGPRVLLPASSAPLVELLPVGVGVGVAHTPAVFVADHRPVLERDGVVGAQVAQCVVRIVVVVPVLMAVVPAPAL